MNDTKKGLPLDQIRVRLAFQRGLLTLLKGTVPLFSPMIEKALQDIDFILDHVD